MEGIISAGGVQDAGALAYRLGVEEVLTALDVDARSGLKEGEARARLLAPGAARPEGGEGCPGLAAEARPGRREGGGRARLARLGPNELSAEKPVPAWRRFLDAQAI